MGCSQGRIVFVGNTRSAICIVLDWRLISSLCTRSKVSHASLSNRHTRTSYCTWNRIVIVIVLLRPAMTIRIYKSEIFRTPSTLDTHDSVLCHLFIFFFWLIESALLERDWRWSDTSDRLRTRSKQRYAVLILLTYRYLVCTEWATFIPDRLSNTVLYVAWYCVQSGCIVNNTLLANNLVEWIYTFSTLIRSWECRSHALFS